MCFDLDSHPPIAPISGGSAEHRRLTLTSADGAEPLAFVARATAGSGAGLVILPDVRGLHAYYEELALRFAEHGIDAIAVDYFARTAVGPELGTPERPNRGEGFEFWPHVERTRLAGVAADTRAAAAYLRSPDGGAVRSLFVVGFCFGGRAAFVAATIGLDTAGVIGFYGPPQKEMNDIPAPVELVGQMTGSVLGIFGGADPSIPPDAIAAFDAALADAGVEHAIVSYPGAPHSFFDRKAAEFADASADAWRQVTEFIAAHA